jgi:steroid 5-alpha reductase family enzyme
MISDAQMRRFRSAPNNRGKNMQSGLWAYSRHPNYLGEVTLWWGVWVIQISVLPALWWTVCAPILMTMLFVFISIPMMEKKLLASKEGYAAYQKSTSMLLLLPPKTPMQEESCEEGAD